jgi:hypothetical protein
MPLSVIGTMTHVISRAPIAVWLEHRMAQLAPLPVRRVRLVGLVVVDPLFADPDASARAAWIGDGDTVTELVDRHAAELDRFDVIAAVTWLADQPHVTVVLVNP